MKNNNIVNKLFDALEAIANTLNDPTAISDNLKKSELFSFQKNFDLTSSLNKNIYIEPENDNIEYNKTVPGEDNKSYENNKSYIYNENVGCNNKQNDSSTPQGVLDSITQELTSARLQQAIILSEIVGKPKSKTRKRRRF
jgi:hypothetical protein